MRNNKILTIASGICFLASSVQAQNFSEQEMNALAYNTTKKSPTIIYTTNNAETTTEAVEIVDYPTISFPETAGFSVEKEKATYHLSWQVMMRENLSYTEVQSSTDGVNFNTVGYVINDNNQKNTNFDYFVPSDKNTNTSFRLVQHGLNAQKHTSDILRVK